MKHIKPLKSIFENNNTFEGYTLKEVADGVKSGTIKINHNNHNKLSFESDKQSFHSGKDINKYFYNVIQELQKDSEEFTTKLINKNNDMSDVYRRMVNMKFKIGDLIVPSISMGNYTCHDCGEYLRPYVQDEHTIVFLGSESIKEVNNGSGVGYKLKPTDDLRCPISKLAIKDKLVAEINVPTGKLVFVNFFKNDEMSDGETDADINALSGRFNLMKELATKDIGYAQMSNMSVDIFAKNDGTEIIVGDNEYYDEDLDIEGEREHPGFKCLGNISCTVWRWMCADKSVLDKYNEKISKNAIVVDVEPGTWVIEHYYDVIGERPDGIYSKMYLKK